MHALTNLPFLCLNPFCADGPLLFPSCPLSGLWVVASLPTRIFQFSLPSRTHRLQVRGSICICVLLFFIQWHFLCSYDPFVFSGVICCQLYHNELLLVFGWPLWCLNYDHIIHLFLKKKKLVCSSSMMLASFWDKIRKGSFTTSSMSISMKDVDPAFRGVGQKEYPHCILFPIFIMAWTLDLTENTFCDQRIITDSHTKNVNICNHGWNDC